MIGGGSIKNMSDKAQECRDNSRAPSASKKSKFKNSAFSSKNGRSYFGGVFMTLGIFVILIFVSFKVLGSYNRYEDKVREDKVDQNAIQKQAEFEQYLLFGNVSLENGFFEEAKVQFNEALILFPFDSSAEAGMSQTLDSLNN